MRTRVSLVAVLAITAVSTAILMGSGGGSAAKSPKQRDFIIAGSEGYGTQECLASQSNCGRIVADSWCEAKGFKSALAYRQLDADEITGTTSSVSSRGKPVDSFLISCKE